MCEQLGLELVDVTRDCYIAFSKPLFGDRLHPYTEYWLFGMCGDGNKECFRRWSDEGNPPDQIRAHWQKLQELDGRPEEREATIRYFQGGTGEFLQRLHTLLTANDVEVITDLRVSELDVPAGGTGVTCNAEGATVSAESVVINGHAFPDIITHAGESTRLERTPNVSHSMVMTLDNSSADPFFYAVYPESELIHLAADLSYGKDCRTPKRRIVVALDNFGLVKHSGRSDLLVTVMEELMDSGLVSPLSRLMSIDIHSIERGSIDRASRDYAQQFDCVTFLETRGGLDRSLIALSQSLNERTPRASQPEPAIHIS